MAEVVLFHHAQGQTAGFFALTDELRAAGHTVHAPDLYDGTTFTDLADGVYYAEHVGFDTIIERGRLAADGLPNDIVYAWFSLGVLSAQMLTETRPGAKGQSGSSRNRPSPYISGNVGLIFIHARSASVRSSAPMVGAVMLGDR